MKIRLKVLTFLCFFISAFSYGQTQVPYFELYSINDETSISCDGVPVVLSIKKSDKNYSFRLIRNDEFYQESSESQVEVLSSGNYFALVNFEGQELKTNSIYIDKCDLKDFFLEKPDKEDEINTINPSISSNGYSLCGDVSSVVLNAYPKGNEYTYKWYYSPSYSGVYQVIPDTTNDSVTVLEAGYYKVLVEDGIDAPGISLPFNVSSQGVARITDLLGYSYSTIHINPGDSVEFNVEMLGQQGPLAVDVRVGLQTYSFESQTNPFKIKLAVWQNSYINISKSISNCGVSYNGDGQLKVVVDDDIDIQYQSYLNVDVCSGQILEIPYTLIGNWGNSRSLSYSIYDKKTGAYKVGKTGLYTNPLQVKIPSDLELNKSYRLNLNVSYPAISNSSTALFLNTTSTGCVARPIVTVSPANESCGQIVLSTEAQSGNSYQWYKNDNLLSGEINYRLVTKESGNYKVKVENAGENYNQTSIDYPILIKGVIPEIGSLNASLCSTTEGALIEINVSSSNVVKYEWLYSPYPYGTPFVIPDANLSTYTSKVKGFFKLRTRDADGCITESNTIEILESGGIDITDASTGNSSSTISPGGTAYLKIKFQGKAPYYLNYFNNDVRKNINTDQSEYILPLSPAHTSNYEFRLSSTGCGLENDYQYYTVNVGASTNFNLGTPTSLNYCLGGRVVVPYTTSGTWGSDRSFYAYLADENGSYINNSDRRIFPGTSNSLNYDIRSNITPGSYYLYVYTLSPYILDRVKSSYKINISSGSCSLPAARLEFNGYADKCSIYSAYEAYPSIDGAIYKWYYNGSLISTTSYSILNTSFGNSTSGQLTVRIEKSGTYNSLSNAVNIVTRIPSGSFAEVSPNNCNLNTLTSYNSFSSSYQWYYARDGFGYEKINGANSYSHSPAEKGYYLLKSLKDGCELMEEFYCNRGIELEPQKVCRGGSIAIRYHSLRGEELIFQLLDAENSSVLVENLYSTTFAYSYGSDVSNVTLPMTITSGEYRIRMLIANTLESYDSNEIIEVLSHSIIENPVITFSPSEIESAGVVTLTLTGCQSSSPVWSNGLSQNSFTSYINPGSSYSAYCLSFEGCKSEEVRQYLNHVCDDGYEPNDRPMESSLINSLNFSSESLCFKNGEDSDWFSFVHNGRQYFVEIKPYSTNASIAGRFYNLSKTLVGDEIELQTNALSGSNAVDTYMTLFDSEMNQVAANDDGNGVLSRIIFNPSNPCQSMVNLISPNFDLYSGQSSYIRSLDYINSSSIQNNETNNLWEAGKSILLEPGFETKIETQGVFKSEIKKCID